MIYVIAVIMYSMPDGHIYVMFSPILLLYRLKSSDKAPWCGDGTSYLVEILRGEFISRIEILKIYIPYSTGALAH